MAFYVPHAGEKDRVLREIIQGNHFEQLIPVRTLVGEVFSNERLQYFIDEEVRHDHFEITNDQGNALARSSSGEQRKALLNYLVAQQPGYLIIDNVFESLDESTCNSLLSTLQQLSENIVIIQVLSRHNDLLPFIDTIYVINNSAEMVQQDRQAFITGSSWKVNKAYTSIIPPSLVQYVQPVGPLVRMKNVSVQFDGRHILHNICWEINEGEFWQLSGPNGSGKSTLLALITGNSPKGYGQDLELFGRRKGSGETVWEIKEKIGYFSPSMTMHFERQDTVEQMILSGFFDSVGLYIRPSDRQLDIARQWISILGMEEEKKKPFRMIASGYQRMVMIARAMVKHPLLLILDEPTAGLDDEMALLFTTLINKIAVETSTAIIYVSHRREQGLTASTTFKLTPGEMGSTGSILNKK